METEAKTNSKLKTADSLVHFSSNLITISILVVNIIVATLFLIDHNHKFLKMLFYLIVSPSLRKNVTTQFVLEGYNISIDLKVSSADDPFPPPTSIWMFDGKILTGSSNTILYDLAIAFYNVQRNMSGNYSLTVTNTAGQSFGTFELNIECKN